MVKIGSATLTHETGRLNLRRLERLAAVLSDLANRGLEIVLVSSGAVSAGMAKLELTSRPREVDEIQACAAVGQAELMFIYERAFGLFGRKIAQILLTRDAVDVPARRANAEAIFATILRFGCLPIVNENDAISSEEIKFSGNDILSAYVARLCRADLLVNLTDQGGLYTADPRKSPEAKLIRHVPELTDEIFDCAGGAGTERGTGGAYSKLEAALIAAAYDIPTIIARGADPAVLYDICDGRVEGTYIGKI